MKNSPGTNYFATLNDDIDIALTSDKFSIGGTLLAVYACCNGNPNTVALQADTYAVGCSILRTDVVSGANLYFNTGTTAIPVWTLAGGGGGGTIGGTIAATQVAFGSALDTIAGSANFIWTTASNLLTISSAALGAIPADALKLQNNNASSSGAPVQISPALEFLSHMRQGTGPGSPSDHTGTFRIYQIPFSGNIAGTNAGNLQIDSSKDGVYTTNIFSLNRGGSLTVPSTITSSNGSINATIGSISAGSQLIAGTDVVAGFNGGASGAIYLVGSTSGSLAFTAPAIISNYSLALPANGPGGVSGLTILSDGLGGTTWGTPSAGTVNVDTPNLQGDGATFTPISLNTVIVDTSAVESLDFDFRQLTDSSNVESFDWNLRIFKDQSGLPILNYDNLGGVMTFGDVSGAINVTQIILQDSAKLISIGNPTFQHVDFDGVNKRFSMVNVVTVKSAQYETPTTGSTVTFGAGSEVMTINPAGALLALTIAFPASPVNGETRSFNSTQAVTTLTLSGGTFIGGLTTLSLGGFATYIYSSGDSKWHRQA